MIMSALLALVIQTTVPPVVPVLPPNTPYRIAFEAEPDVTLRWWCNNTIVRNFTAADLVKGAPTTDPFIAYEAAVPGLPAGVHSCLVSATRLLPGSTTEFWPEVKSDPISILVGSGPLTPIGVRVIVTIVVK
jgi:hypothetical protein